MSTHYVNLPHYFLLTERPKISIDQQHFDLSWFDLDEVVGSGSFHKYVRNYASLLINSGINND